LLDTLANFATVVAV